MMQCKQTLDTVTFISARGTADHCALDQEFRAQSPRLQKGFRRIGRHQLRPSVPL